MICLNHGAGFLQFFIKISTVFNKTLSLAKYPVPEGLLPIRANFPILVGFLYFSQNLFACFPTLGKILALRWIISNPFHIRPSIFLQFQCLESTTLFTLFHSFSYYGCFWFLIIGLNSPNVVLAMSYSLAMFYSLSRALHCTEVLICVCFKSCVISNLPKDFQVYSWSGLSKFPWHLSPISAL